MYLEYCIVVARPQTTGRILCDKVNSYWVIGLTQLIHDPNYRNKRVLQNQNYFNSLYFEQAESGSQCVLCKECEYLAIKRLIFENNLVE